MSEHGGAVEKIIVNLLDNGSRLQGPAVAKYVEHIRRAHPDDTPAQIIERLEKQFLLAVTGSGSAAGATAAFPGIGTLTAIGAIGAEAVFFLEASALLTLAIASVHGIEPHDHQQRRALVLAVALGDTGKEIVAAATGTSLENWSKALTTQVGSKQLKIVNNTLVKKFIRKYAAKRSALILGKLVPAGIGAAIGGVGNRTIGKRTIINARSAFGPAPTVWPDVALPPQPAVPELPSRTAH
ncbi:MAG: YbdD/YjiX family protein [Rhodococcus sp.]|uniref:YbdD/YjiX family protein n=1 Tax=Rhodococcus TaxID=1827 RepID=UPI0016B714F9|nr:MULTISPECIES: YbdD/YjiX family protein [Rhodococcus]NLV79718.1 YbdD/YjiX family protein [Rhodococcus sp. (in: high G+C Gram-positive bacteria)]